ncbi:iron-sulfur cluster repair protein YtfE [Ruminiclostridium hungatei]|uniref:Iron-sulfur cluster repair protein YtfE n=1 Tax=Ruminiclostridium hungatei TaxID=48256 RepID=A0A1V4SE16_RUMHU|nr:iron-sulfur cluster repair protein YtfE [Ruminiclostridium hungatei]
MTKINIFQTLGEIVSAHPQASAVFKKYNIDFCCGGNRPLADAIREQELNGEELLSVLEEACFNAKEQVRKEDFRDMAPPRLIEYIVGTHHAFLRRALPEAGELAEKILRAHGTRHQELFKVHKLFNSLRAELEEHLIKEEELLFPLINEYEGKPSQQLFQEIRRVMEETEDEHEGAGHILKELRNITSEYVVPEDGCVTYELAYSKLREIESDLFEHIHLENNILFKRFRTIIDLSRPVHDLCKENPSVVEILRELGFDQITNPAMLNTAGRFMTIPKGAVMKGVDLGRIKIELEKRGFDIKD